MLEKTQKVTGEKTTITVHTQDSKIPDAELEQLKQMASADWINKDTRIEIMPDYHVGTGCTIGTTIRLDSSRIDPRAVGVDIGCGVSATRLDVHAIDFDRLEHIIEDHVPSGNNLFNARFPVSWLSNFIAPIDKHYAERSLGTLGGGNHFIEIDKDRFGDYWLVIHTGSRHLGLELCYWYTFEAPKAQLRAERESTISFLKAQGRETEIEDALSKLKPKDYIYDTQFFNYMYDMSLACEYAHYNHKSIIFAICTRMGWEPQETIFTQHNYIGRDMILRKGAVSAHADEKFLVPLNMAEGVLLCEGKGNADWNCSAPHGAGRIMSRSEAFSQVSKEDFVQQMADANVITYSANGATVDEAPVAYKSAESIENSISPTARVLDHWRPVFNYKAH